MQFSDNHHTMIVDESFPPIHTSLTYVPVSPEPPDELSLPRPAQVKRPHLGFVGKGPTHTVLYTVPDINRVPQYTDIDNNHFIRNCVVVVLTTHIC